MPADRKQYARINWVNKRTKLNQDNLNQMDEGIALSNALAIEDANYIDEIFEALITQLSVSYNVSTHTFHLGIGSSTGNNPTTRFNVSKNIIIDVGDVEFNQLVTDLNNGAKVVARAAADETGNNIKATYANSINLVTEFTASSGTFTLSLVNKNGDALMTREFSIPLATTSITGLLSPADKAKIDNIATNISDAISTAETYTDNKVARNNLVTVLGESSQALNGLMSSEDKRRLDVLYGLLGETEDANNVVDTINEILSLFSQYPEGQTILAALGTKLNTADFNTAIANYYTKTEADTLLAGKHNVINGSNKLASDYVDDTSSTNKFVSAAEKTQITANQTDIAEHKSKKDNPHEVTATQVGLGNVVNTGDSDTPVENGTTKFTTGGAFIELNKKVDKVNGKGLSTNDFDNTYKDNVDQNTTDRHTHSNKSVLDNTSASFTTDDESKLGNIESGAQVNVIETVKVNNTALTVTNKTVNVDLSSYATIAGMETYCKSLVMSIDPATFVITLSLKDANNNVLSTQTIDLPLETMVVSGEYDSTNQKIVLTLKNSNTIDVPVAALISGLVNSTSLATTLENYYTSSQVDAIANTKVDKVNGKGLSTNDFTDSYVTQVTENTANRHSHSNKSLLDEYTQTESDLASAVSNTHSHSNKALLDTYSQTEANLESAVNLKHSHSNKAVLDATTASFTSEEKSKLGGIEAGAEANDIVGVKVNGVDLTIDSNRKVDVEVPTTLDEISDGQSRKLNEFCKKVTWSQLKELRDNKQLIPGMNYRITDYDTYTIQSNTRSAMHHFDIIVNADDEQTLNENARACISARDTEGYFSNTESFLASANWVNGVQISDVNFLGLVYEGDEELHYDANRLNESSCVITELTTAINEDGIEVPAMVNPDPDDLEPGAIGNQLLYVYDGTLTLHEIINSEVTVFYTITDGDEIRYDGLHNNEDIIVKAESDYYDFDGTDVMTPMLYKTAKEYINLDSDEIETDYEDKFVYVGDYEIDGVTYNKWLKVEFGTETEFFILTNVIVEDGDFIIDPDDVRNGVENTAIIYEKWIEYDIADETYQEGLWHLTRGLVNATYNAIVTSEKLKLSRWKLKYSLDNNPIFEWCDPNSGKGVIYWMQDEFGNEAPYDFKNIQFKRWKIYYGSNSNWFLNGDNEDLDECILSKYIAPSSFGDSNLIFTTQSNDYKYFYTFSCYNEGNSIQDATSLGHEFTCNNKISLDAYIREHDEDYLANRITYRLPNITLICNNPSYATLKNNIVEDTLNITLLCNGITNNTISDCYGILLVANNTSIINNKLISSYYILDAQCNNSEYINCNRIFKSLGFNNKFEDCDNLKSKMTINNCELKNTRSTVFTNLVESSRIKGIANSSFKSVTYSTIDISYLGNSNSFSGTFQLNTIICEYFQNNTFADNFSENKIVCKSFQNNTIKSFYNNQVICDDFNSNNLDGGQTYYCSFFGSFSNNETNTTDYLMQSTYHTALLNRSTFVGRCNYNKIGRITSTYVENSCEYNEFGVVTDLKLGLSCSHNIFRGRCTNITFGSECTYNTIETNQFNVTLGAKCSYCRSAITPANSGDMSVRIGDNCTYVNVTGRVRHYDIDSGCSYLHATSLNITGSGTLKCVKIGSNISGSSDQNRLNIDFTGITTSDNGEIKFIRSGSKTIEV